MRRREIWGMSVVGAMAGLTVCPAVFSGCAHIGEVRPVPLYPMPEQPRPRETLAQLQGPIRSVDGRDVELAGSAFMLLPGCHVVVVKPKIGAGDGQGAWSADLGRVVYAFSMRAGKLYSIEAVPVFQSAGHGTVTLRAYERNGDGSVVRSVGAAQEREIVACLAGQDAAGGAAVDGEFPDRSASRGEDPTASLSLSVPK